MKEIQPGAPSSEEVPQKGRRGFLRGIIAGGVGLYVGNKYLEKEKELNKLFATFEGKQEDFSSVVNAMNGLIVEMHAENLTKVKLSGTGGTNEKINYLRDFITQHLTSKVSTKYPQSIKELIFKSGFYSIDSLAELAKIANSVIKIPDLKFDAERKVDQNLKERPFIKTT